MEDIKDGKEEVLDEVVMVLEMLVDQCLFSRVSDRPAPPLSHWQLLEGRGR